MYLVTMLTMGPVGLMKSTRKQKFFVIIGFFLRFSPQAYFDLWKSTKKSWWVGFLNIVSTSGPGLSRLRTGLAVSPLEEYKKVLVGEWGGGRAF